VLVTLPSVRIPNMNRTIYFGIFMAHPSWLASKFGHIMTYKKKPWDPRVCFVSTIPAPIRPGGISSIKTCAMALTA
jgi:hypothetical protein